MYLNEAFLVKFLVEFFLAAISYKYLKLETEPRNLLENNSSSGTGISFLREKETLNM